MTRVLVIDDQRIAREYMEKIVEESGRYRLAGSLSNADMASVVCSRNGVDMILMDVCTHGSKDGITAAGELRQQFPALKIIILTSMPEESFIKRAREVGADSFWHKESSPEDLLTVMDRTMAGDRVWPGAAPVVRLGSTTSAELTEAEIKVLRMVCEGLEYDEIAENLHCSRDNVKYHIRNILQKTGYANKTQLAIAVTGKRYIIPHLFEDPEGAEESPLVL